MKLLIFTLLETAVKHTEESDISAFSVKGLRVQRARDRSVLFKSYRHREWKGSTGLYRHIYSPKVYKSAE